MLVRRRRRAARVARGMGTPAWRQRGGNQGRASVQEVASTPPHTPAVRQGRATSPRDGCPPRRSGVWAAAGSVPGGPWLPVHRVLRLLPLGPPLWLHVPRRQAGQRLFTVRCCSVQPDTWLEFVRPPDQLDSTLLVWHVGVALGCPATPGRSRRLPKPWQPPFLPHAHPLALASHRRAPSTRQ